MFELQRGNLPAVFAVPAGVGDFLVGLTAPLVAVSLLRKRKAVVWAAAITWNALGITDLVYAVTLGVLSGQTYVQTSYLAVTLAFFVPLFIISHIITVLLLLRKDVKLGFTEH